MTAKRLPGCDKVRGSLSFFWPRDSYCIGEGRAGYHDGVLERIERLLELESTITISDDGRRAINYIRAMQGDDPKFADCATFREYLVRAMQRLPLS